MELQKPYTDKILVGHCSEVESVAFSPDGARVVTTSGDETAQNRDAATGTAIAVLGGHDSEVGSAAFSPDGKRIVTATSDKTARIWDVSLIPKGNLFQIGCAGCPITICPESPRTMV
jgi:WD40 repeat protein